MENNKSAKEYDDELEKQCTITVGELRNQLRHAKDSDSLLFIIGPVPYLLFHRVKWRGENLVTIELDCPYEGKYVQAVDMLTSDSEIDDMFGNNLI